MAKMMRNHDIVRGRPSQMSLGAIIYCFLFSKSIAFSASSKCAIDSVKEQLGYLPTNFLSVSASKINNGDEPVAIKTYPLNGGSRRRQAKAEVAGALSSPFPTMYWLTCPEISRAVSELERRGCIHEFEEELKSKPNLASRLVQCHEEYAEERWRTLSDEDRSLLLSDNPAYHRMREMIQFSGISGTNFKIHAIGDSMLSVAPVKCLHAHYAHYRSTLSSKYTQNPIGEMIHRELVKEFPDLEL